MYLSPFEKKKILDLVHVNNILEFNQQINTYVYAYKDMSIFIIE